MDISLRLQLEDKLNQLCKEYCSQDFISWTCYGEGKLDVVEIFGDGDRTIAKFSFPDVQYAFKAVFLWIENEMKEE